MYEYIQGQIVSRQPTHAVIDAGGVGYLLHITLHAYNQIPESGIFRIYTWLQVTEDAHRLWGFVAPAERDVFLHLVSVSGIGPNTARLILSGMTPEECSNAILTDNELAFRQVKGVGPKTAKRVIMELKDKILKSGAEIPAIKSSDSTSRSVEEALSALVTLGFNRPQAEKALHQIVKTSTDVPTTESLVRLALRQLSA